MIMATRVCYRHPDRKAINRCYYCKKPVCKECRLHLGHHYFCSRKCYYLYRIQQQVNRFKKHQPVFLLAWRVLVTVLVLVFGAQLIFGNRPWGKPQVQLSADSTTVTREQQAELSGALKNAANAIVVHRKIVNEGQFTLNVPVQAGWVITVWHNDWPIHSAISARRKMFRLEIPLTLGKNRIRMQITEKGKPVITELLELEYRNPAVRALSRSVEQVRTDAPFVALTFDGGSSAEGADSILAVLRRHNVTVTMFLTGRFIQRYPRLVKQIVADGHQVGNHTYSHPHLTTYAQNGRHHTLDGVTRAFLRRQLLMTDSLFFRVTGQHLAPLWRAPYGEINRDILTWAAELGYLHVGWSRGLDTFDWVSDTSSSLYRTPDQALHRILFSRGKPRPLKGKIILMHLGNHRARPMYKMLPALLDSLKRRNLQVVTVQQLLTGNL